MTMIKWVFVFVGTLLLSNMAYAGCAMKGRYNPVEFVSSSATNASISSSRISGTSGCGTSEDLTSIRQQHFIANNQTYLLTDIARGSGEYLASMSKLMGCGQQVQSQFSGAMQANMEHLIPAAPLSATEILSRMRLITANDKLLNTSCAFIG